MHKIDKNGHIASQFKPDSFTPFIKGNIDRKVRNLIETVRAIRSRQKISNDCRFECCLKAVNESGVDPLPPLLGVKLLEALSDRVTSTAWIDVITREPSLCESFVKIRNSVLNDITCGLLNVPSLSNVAASLARLRFVDQEIIDTLEKSINQNLSGFENNQIAVMVHAFAVLVVNKDGVFNRLVGEISKKSNINFSDYALIAWSCAVMDDSLAIQFLNENCSKFNIDTGNTRGLIQVHQAEVSVGLRQPGDFCPALKARLEKIEFKHDKPENRKLWNSFEHNVGKALINLAGLKTDLCITPHYMQDLIEIDYLISTPRKKVALECDGLKCHACSDGRRLGREIIQDKIFKRANLHVVHIDKRRWDSLEPDRRVDWLSEEICS